MMPFYGSPEELERVAAEIHGHAAVVRDMATEYVNKASAMRWHGIAADRFRERAQQDKDTLDTASEGLDDAAEKLRAHASTIRERLALIAHFENSVGEWFHDASSWLQNAVHQVASGVHSVWNHFMGRSENSPTPPWSGLNYSPQSLPESGNKEWLDVGEYMKQQGKI